MVSKDQAIGGIILIVCVVIAALYFVAIIFANNIIDWFAWSLEPSTLQLWLVAIPVVIAFLAILGIGAWIGWTMATTPPPKPIEEIEAEMETEAEEEKAKEEEKEKKKK